MKFIKKAPVFLVLLSVLPAMLAAPAFALGDWHRPRHVKVGYMNHPNFIERDAEGNMVGYGVEYLDEICKYVNWEIEYVYASWETQLSLLRLGGLDIVPAAQYSENRAETFAFSRQPVCNMQLILSVRADNDQIYYNDFPAMDGARIGMIRGDQSISYLEEYASLHEFDFDLVEYAFRRDALRDLMQGKLDMLASEQSMSSTDTRIVGHFDSDPNYFMCSKDNPRLLRELDYAMDEIYSNDSTYRYKLYEKYYGQTALNARPSFTREEVEFIANAGRYTFSLVPDAQPSSYINEDGEVAGIIPDIMEEISALCGIDFDYTFSPPGDTPLSYMKANPELLLTGVLSTNPIFRLENLLVSDAFYTSYAALLGRTDIPAGTDYLAEGLRIGVVPQFQALHLYIRDNYPKLQLRPDYHNVQEGLLALSRGEVELFAYDLNAALHYWGGPRSQNTTILSTSFLEEPHCVVGMNTPENRLLISIINKCIAVLPRETVSRIERTHLSTNYYRTSAVDILYQLRIPLGVGVCLMVFIILFLALSKLKDMRVAELLEQKNVQLAVIAKQAEQASRAKSEFLSRMSHDIRTPMNAIMGMTEIARNGEGNPAKTKECLDKIVTSSRILLQLLNDILDSTAIERGKLKIAQEPFALEPELYGAVNLYAQQCEKKGLSFSMDCDRLGDTHLLGDPLRLTQILQNLLSNACKFTEPPGSVSITVQELSRSSDALMLRFTIQDSGSGMDEETLSRIFEPFEQKDAAIALRYGGSGLGLSIVKNLVTMMGGSILVKSSPGKGSVFTVDLPFLLDPQIPDAMEPSSVDDKKDKLDFDFTGRHILVADDDAFNRDVVEGLLALVHGESCCVENGQLALEAFAGSPPGTYDAILLDVHMPVMDGHMATKEIRSCDHPQGASIPIFALTADAFPEEVVKALRCGMTGYLTKPIFAQELYLALEKSFDRKGVCP